MAESGNFAAYKNIRCRLSGSVQRVATRVAYTPRWSGVQVRTIQSIAVSYGPDRDHGNIGRHLASVGKLRADDTA
jgi:hypothetical protein